MSRNVEDWILQDPRDFMLWLLRQLEALSDEKGAYESRVGRPWSDKDREWFENARGYSENLELMFDIAGVEWSAAQVRPMARHLRNYIAGHWPDGREVRTGPVLVFPAPDPEGPEDDGDGGEAPPEGAA